jgi:hypothetical protein
MSRVLVIAALVVSLIVPVGAVALSATSPGSDPERQTIEMPTTPTADPITPPTSVRSEQSTSQRPTPAVHGSSNAPTSTVQPPRTRSVELFDGRRVKVSHTCVVSRNLDSHKSDAIAAAKALPPLKQRLLDTRRDLKTFLARHPGKYLESADYAAYESLQGTHESARLLYNGEVDRFNTLRDVYNNLLTECEIG